MDIVELVRRGRTAEDSIIVQGFAPSSAYSEQPYTFIPTYVSPPVYRSLPYRHPFFGTYLAGAARYDVYEELGHGAYGLVAGALDRLTGERVAIKHITHVFDSVVDAKRMLREIYLLKRLSHDNIISLRDILVPRDPTSYNELYVVFERLDTDLLKLIQSSQYLSPAHVKHFLYHTLRGLKYLHSANVFHRDMKPANLLVNRNCELKICDFGMARCITSMDSSQSNSSTMRRCLSAHVVTRWYRAPEVILQHKTYTHAIDVWSVGCIFAELLEMLKTCGYGARRRPLFPGASCYPMSPATTEHLRENRRSTDQLEAIFEVIGTPTDEEISRVRSVKIRNFLRSYPYRTGRSFGDVFPGADPLALDLLQRMLAFDPADRPTVEACLEHPFLSSPRRHDPENQYESISFEPIVCDFDDLEMTANEIRERMFMEIVTMRQPALFPPLAMQSPVMQSPAMYPMYNAPNIRASFPINTRKRKAHKADIEIGGRSFVAADPRFIGR